MKNKFNLLDIDKKLNKTHALNPLINKILKLVIPQSTAIACDKTDYHLVGDRCPGNIWACDGSTDCFVWHKYYTDYYNSSWVYQCSICNYWIASPEICVPCPV